MAYLNLELPPAGHIGLVSSPDGRHRRRIAAADRRLTEAVGPRRPLRARQARAHRAGRQGVPPRPGHQRHRGARARHGCYAALLTHKGKMLGDLRVLDTGDELWLDTERVGAAGAVRHDPALRARLATSSCTSARSSRRCSRSSGPAPREAVGGPVGPEHDNARRELGGARCCSSRPTSASTSSAPPRTPSACAARSSVARGARGRGRGPARRAGRPRYGIDLDDATIPQEAGLNDRAVSFTKGCYVGQETVARLHYRGKPNRHLRGLRLSDPVASGDAARARRARGRPRGLERRSRPRHGADRAGAGAPRGGVGDELAAGDARAAVVELPF